MVAVCPFLTIIKRTVGSPFFLKYNVSSYLLGNSGAVFPNAGSYGLKAKTLIKTILNLVACFQHHMFQTEDKVRGLTAVFVFLAINQKPAFFIGRRPFYI